MNVMTTTRGGFSRMWVAAFAALLLWVGATPAVRGQTGADSAAQLTLLNISTGLESPTREGGRTELEVGDINGDGQLDIVSVGDHGSPGVNSEQRGITLYLGDGGSSWNSWQSGNFGYGGCAIGDLDLDGNLDLAWGIHHDWGVAGFGGELMGAALGDGAATSWTPWGAGLATNGESWGMFSSALADFDCDGDLDLVSQSFGGSNGLALYGNNLDGTWTHVWSAPGGSVSFTIEACDVNADGYADIVSTRSGSKVYLGDGAFGFTLATAGLPTSLFGLHTGDMDNDGTRELVFCTGNDGIRCYKFDPGSSSWSSISAGLPTTQGYSVAQFGDLNGDGFLDIVGFRTEIGKIWLGDGAGNWTGDATWNMPAPGTASALRVDGDMDHDGRDDIVVASLKSGFPFSRNQLRVYSPRLVPSLLSATVAEPLGGETLQAGSVREIRWRAAVPPADGPATVDLELSLNGAAGPFMTLAAGVPDNGRWQWAVGQQSGSSCRVRVTVTTAAGTVSALSANDFTIVGGSTPAPLVASAETLPEAGGTIDFALDAGTAYADRTYLMLASVSGTSPGLPLPGGLVTLPLNLDWLSFLVLDNLNSPLFTNFTGVLDGSGTGASQLNVPHLPGAAGLPMHFAFMTRAPYDFVSNPVLVTFVP